MKKAADLKKATELEYLQWVYANIDFGPAHGDVMEGLKEDFMEQSGKELPDGYNEPD